MTLESDPSNEQEMIQFSYDGVAYEVALTPAEAAEFDAVIAPFLRAGRRVPGVGQQHLQPPHRPN